MAGGALYLELGKLLAILDNSLSTFMTGKCHLGLTRVKPEP